MELFQAVWKFILSKSPQTLKQNKSKSANVRRTNSRTMMSLLKFQKQERTKGRLAGQGQVNLMSGETLLFKTRVTCCEFKASELYIFCFIFKTIFNWCLIIPFNVTWNFALLDLTTITENSYEGEWVWFVLRVLRSDATSTWHKEKIVSAKKEKKNLHFYCYMRTRWRGYSL